MNEMIIQTATVTAFVLVLLGVFAVTYRAFYKRTTADLAFVRTGKGMARVVVDDGAFVIGFLHAIRWVSLAPMRAPVVREGRNALVSKDGVKVDMAAEFHVRVSARYEHVLHAVSITRLARVGGTPAPDALEAAPFAVA